MKRVAMVPALVAAVLLAAMSARGAPAAPERNRGAVPGLRVSGNSAIPTVEIVKAAGALSAAGDSASLAAAADRVLERYRDGGYLWAAVSVTPDSIRGPAMEIVEGPAARIGERRVLGAASIDRAEIDRVCVLREGGDFSERALSGDVQRLLALYDARGFPFATVEVGGFRADERGLISYELRVEEGQGAVIERIETSGTDALRPEVVARLLRTRPGERYDGRKLAEGRERLLRSGFFRTVGEIEVLPGSAPGRVVLRVPATGAPVNAAQAVAGYSGADRRLTGLFDLRLGNIAGTARRGRARWEGRGEGVSRYVLEYEEPWLFGSPLALRGGLDHELHEPSFTRTVGLAEIAYPVSGSLSLFGGGTAERSVFPSGARMRSRVSSTHAGIEIDRRDRALGPRDGARLRLLGRRGERRETYRDSTAAAGARRTSLRGLEADFEIYRPIGGRQALALLGRGRLVTAGGGRVPEEERFPLGGAASLRGYREEQFRSSRIGLLQLEYRVLLSPDGTRSFLFTDAGYARPEDGAHGDPVHVGYGAGLRVASKIGLVGVDYGLAAGDGPLDGRIHFRLEAAF